MQIGDVVLVIFSGSQIIGRCHKLEQGKICLRFPFELIVNEDGSIRLVPVGILFKQQDPFLVIENYKYITAGVARDTLAAVYSQNEAQMEQLLPPIPDIKELSKAIIKPSKEAFSQKYSTQGTKNTTQCRIIKFSPNNSK